MMTEARMFWYQYDHLVLVFLNSRKYEYEENIVATFGALTRKYDGTNGYSYRKRYCAKIGEVIITATSTRTSTRATSVVAMEVRVQRTRSFTRLSSAPEGGPAAFQMKESSLEGPTGSRWKPRRNSSINYPVRSYRTD
eukprot:scaffold132597_cov15-Prasinocladus_malaysianus.AAC.1